MIKPKYACKGAVHHYAVLEVLFIAIGCLWMRYKHMLLNNRFRAALFAFVSHVSNK
jgi:hypothetical protein